MRSPDHPASPVVSQVRAGLGGQSACCATWAIPISVPTNNRTSRILKRCILSNARSVSHPLTATPSAAFVTLVFGVSMPRGPANIKHQRHGGQVADLVDAGCTRQISRESQGLLTRE